MLQPDYDTRRIAVRRRNRANPWFQRGDQYRCALDVLRKATAPLTAREIVMAMVAGFRCERFPQFVRKQKS
jgi:hypothetical protein